MKYFWDLLFHAGYRIENWGRILRIRAIDRKFRPIQKGLGFPDDEAQELAHKIMTTMSNMWPYEHVR